MLKCYALTHGSYILFQFSRVVVNSQGYSCTIAAGGLQAEFTVVRVPVSQRSMGSFQCLAHRDISQAAHKWVLEEVFILVYPCLL